MLTAGVLKIDPVMSQLRKLGTQLDDLQASFDKMLDAIRALKMRDYGDDIKKLDKALAEIRGKEAEGLNNRNKRLDIIQIIEQSGIASSTPLPVKMLRDFLGGMDTTIAKMEDAAYPVLFEYHNDVDFRTGRLSAAKTGPKKFYGREREGLYRDALNNIRVIFSAGMALAQQYQYLQISRIDPAAQPEAHADAVNRLDALADTHATYDSLLEDLGNFRALPQEYVYLNIEDDAAWFNDPEYIHWKKFYGG